MELSKLSELLEYSVTSVVDMSNIGIEPYVDAKGDSSNSILPDVQEIVYNKERDKEITTLKLRVGKIYDAFMYGDHKNYWQSIIIERFEKETDIDFMLLVSYVYMKVESSTEEERGLQTVTDIAYVLNKFVK